MSNSRGASFTVVDSAPGSSLRCGRVGVDAYQAGWRVGGRYPHRPAAGATGPTKKVMTMSDGQVHGGTDARPADRPAARNPFGVMDAPEPDSVTAADFAAHTTLDGAHRDADAQPWGRVTATHSNRSVEGRWSRRWNRGGGPHHRG